MKSVIFFSILFTVAIVQGEQSENALEIKPIIRKMLEGCDVVLLAELKDGNGDAEVVVNKVIAGKLTNEAKLSLNRTKHNDIAGIKKRFIFGYGRNDLNAITILRVAVSDYGSVELWEDNKWLYVPLEEVIAAARILNSPKNSPHVQAIPSDQNLLQSEGGKIGTDTAVE